MSIERNERVIRRIVDASILEQYFFFISLLYTYDKSVLFEQRIKTTRYHISRRGVVMVARYMYFGCSKFPKFSVKFDDGTVALFPGVEVSSDSMALAL